MAFEVKAADRRLFSHMVAGLVGLAAAAAVVHAAARMQTFLGAPVLLALIFVFPTPVALGIAIGLAAPRRAVVWGPVWACVVSAIALALLSASIINTSAFASPLRLATGLSGIVLAGLAAVGARRAVDSANSRKLVLAFVLACGVVAGIQQVLLTHHQSGFQRLLLPQVISELNNDYITVPAGIDWQCHRLPSRQCYELSAVVRGDELAVLVAADAPEIQGITYSHHGEVRSITSDRSASAYLASLGFRPRLLTTLTRSKGTADWHANMESTRLSLSPAGAVEVLPASP